MMMAMVKVESQGGHKSSRRFATLGEATEYAYSLPSGMFPIREVWERDEDDCWEMVQTMGLMDMDAIGDQSHGCLEVDGLGMVSW
jgi:hypothetical protein